MAFLKTIWRWLLRLIFIAWILLLLLLVLKFYKDNPGAIELTLYKLQFEIPTFVLGILPLLLAALVVTLISWVVLLRLKLRRALRRQENSAKALRASTGG